MSDEPIKFEERMFDQIKVDEDKPTMPFEDCFQQFSKFVNNFCFYIF